MEAKKLPPPYARYSTTTNKRCGQPGLAITFTSGIRCRLRRPLQSPRYRFDGTSGMMCFESSDVSHRNCWFSSLPRSPAKSGHHKRLVSLQSSCQSSLSFLTIPGHVPVSESHRSHLVPEPRSGSTNPVRETWHRSPFPATMTLTNHQTRQMAKSKRKPNIFSTSTFSDPFPARKWRLNTKRKKWEIQRWMNEKIK